MTGAGPGCTRTRTRAWPTTSSPRSTWATGDLPQPGNSILAQLGFAVSSGIVLAAFVVATFFTPSLTALVGRAAWWPGDSGPRSVATPAAANPEQPQGVTTAKHRRG